MRFVTERFGQIEVDAEDIFDFPLGIIGFPEYHRYGIHRDDKLLPFMWLQSLEEPRLCFFVVEPFLLFPNYEVSVRIEGSLEKDLTKGGPLTVLGIVTIAPEFAESTINLLAPLIVNPAQGRGYQIVMDDSVYTTRHRVFPDKEAPAEEAKSVSEASNL